jgi:hypothetical protein
MAKNWRKLLPDNAETFLEIDLKKSFNDLLQLDDTLKDLMEECEELEQQIKTLSGVSNNGNEPARNFFDQPIESFQTKRKQDKKQFETKRYLEEKIATKKLAFKHWENQRNKFKIKVNRAKKLIDRSQSIKDDFLKDNFEARWQQKRNDFKDKKIKKPIDIWSKKQDEQKESAVSKNKVSILKKVTEKVKLKVKAQKLKDTWGELRTQAKEAKKLKAKGEKKWNEIQKKSMVDSFDILPKEAKKELRQFDGDFKKSTQNKKDDFEEKQQNLKDKFKAKAAKTRNSLTSKKKKENKKEAKQKEEQQEGLKKKQAEEKHEEERQQRQIQSIEEKKKKRNREKKREERREERKNRKKDKYA